MGGERKSGLFQRPYHPLLHTALPFTWDFLQVLFKLVKSSSPPIQQSWCHHRAQPTWGRVQPSRDHLVYSQHGVKVAVPYPITAENHRDHSSRKDGTPASLPQCPKELLGSPWGRPSSSFCFSFLPTSQQSTSGVPRSHTPLGTRLSLTRSLATSPPQGAPAPPLVLQPTAPGLQLPPLREPPTPQGALRKPSQPLTELSGCLKPLRETPREPPPSPCAHTRPTESPTSPTTLQPPPHHVLAAPHTTSLRLPCCSRPTSPTVLSPPGMAPLPSRSSAAAAPRSRTSPRPP